MTGKTKFDRRIGAKLQSIVDTSDEDGRRRKDYRRWLWAVPRPAGSDGHQILAATTITLDVDRASGARGRAAASKELVDFLEGNDLALQKHLPHQIAATRYDGNQVRTVLRKEDIAKVARFKGVRFIGVSDPVHPVLGVVADLETRDDFPGDPPAIPDDLVAEVGNHKVLVGLIDVDGFDFTHPVFLDKQGKTRFVRIWDQTTLPPAKGRPGSPASLQKALQKGAFQKFDYGHEFRADAMNQAMADSSLFAYWSIGLPTKAPGSHGTHVASIAGGSIGFCRTAYLAGVVFARDPKEVDQTSRDRSRGDGERLRDAVSYLLALAAELDVPLVINVSLGRNCGAHDGSASICRDIEAMTADAGCCVVVAAGNTGDSRDDALVEGRVHVSGDIDKKNPTKLSWQVRNDDPTDNEMEVWYDEHDRLSVKVTAPDGTVVGPVDVDAQASGTVASDGTRIFIQHTSYDEDNGCNYAYVQLSPKGGKGTVAAGDWTVELSAAKSSADNGAFHAWIERDDDRFLFQSHFAGTDLDKFNRTKVNSLACGQNTIAVANWDLAHKQPHPTSSQGPTRDRRWKPDVAAPGTNIWGANGFPVQDGVDIYPPLVANRRFLSMTGTSMASPWVAGVAGLMLAINKDLTAAQVRAIIVRAAMPTWEKQRGFGPFDYIKCLYEAHRLKK
jgi:subtilisin family serine protease